MFRLFKYLLLIIVAFGISSCGKENTRPSAEVDEEIAAAVKLGRSQAMELKFGMLTDTIEIEKRLIDVRARERKLRTAGENKLADKYIQSFVTTLDSVNPPLSAMIR